MPQPHPRRRHPQPHPTPRRRLSTAAAQSARIVVGQLIAYLLHDWLG